MTLFLEAASSSIKRDAFLIAKQAETVVFRDFQENSREGFYVSG